MGDNECRRVEVKALAHMYSCKMRFGSTLNMRFASTWAALANIMVSCTLWVERKLCNSQPLQL